MTVSRVLIYTGHRGGLGPYHESVKGCVDTFTVLAKRFSWKVCQVRGEDLTSTLAKQVFRKTMLVIPAGPSTILERTFAEEELFNIEDACKKGVKLVLICGSAFLFSHIRAWQASEKALKSTYKLSKMPLFPGIAKGPLYFSSHKNSDMTFRHQAVELSTKWGKIKLLNSGGGAFVSEDEGVEVLATYSAEELERLKKATSWKNAIIKYRLGLGEILMSMVHFELGPEKIDEKMMKHLFRDREKDWAKIKKSLSTDREIYDYITSLLKSSML